MRRHPELMRRELDPIFRGLDRCDLCGAKLAPEDGFYGLCAACQTSPPPKAKTSHTEGRVEGETLNLGHPGEPVSRL